MSTPSTLPGTATAPARATRRVTVVLATIKWDLVWQRHQALAVAATERSGVVFVESQPRSARQLFSFALRTLLSILRSFTGGGERTVGVTNPRPDDVRLVGASPLALLWPAAWARLTARSITATYPGAPVDVILYAPTPAYVRLARRLEKSGGTVVYDAVVDWDAVPAGWWPPRHARRREIALPAHWRITSDSSSLAGVLSAVMGRPVDVVLPAADPAFAEYPWSAGPRSGTIGWFGVVRDETDVDLLAHCARAGLAVETIGPVETPELRARLESAGVVVRPALSPAELPAAMAHWDAVVCAYRGARAGTITPAKIFNAIAGFTVLTRGLHLPGQLAAAVTDLPADDDAAVAVIRQALATPTPRADRQSQTWSDRLDQLLGTRSFHADQGIPRERVGGDRSNVVDRPKFSIVVPTYNRRDVLVGTVQALAAVEQPWPVELIVVVDGSDDGSAEAVRALRLPMATRVIEQQNAGAAAARNRGGYEATGERVLFLDDDMMADHQLLVEHEKRYAAGADAVIGDIPLDPGSPRNLLSIGVEEWATARRDRLADAGGRLTIDDLLTGQLSVRTDVFREIGGFDSAFTTDGQFGGEDTDFGYRLLARGARVQYAPDAVTYQRYVVTPQQHLRQWRQAGRADAMLSLKHPAMAAELAQRNGGRRRARLLAAVRRLVPVVVRRVTVAAVVRRAARGSTGPLTRFAYGRVREAHYWAGRYEAGGRPDAPIPLQVLAYHGVDDDAHGPADDYAVTAGRLAEHLAGLVRQGFTFIDLDTYLGHLRGRPVQRPSLLLTFDDGYRGLLEHAAPIVTRLGIPAVVFVVSGQLSGWNRWDCPDPDAGVRLLSAEELHELRDQGWTIESHTQNHAHLSQLTEPELDVEVGLPRTDLAVEGFHAPRVLAYPYGEHSRRVRKAAARAGYRAAFALRTRTGRAGGDSRYALPRIEVQHDTSFGDLLQMIMEPPTVSRRAVARREIRAVLRRLRPSNLRRRSRRHPVPADLGAVPEQRSVEPVGLRLIERARRTTEHTEDSSQRQGVQ